MLDHRVLGRLTDAGVEDAVVNVHYLAGRVEAHLSGRTHPRITVLGRRRRAAGNRRRGEEGAAAARAPSFAAPIPTRSGTRPAGLAMAAMAEAWDPARMDILLLLADLDFSLGFDGAGDFFTIEDRSACPSRHGSRRPLDLCRRRDPEAEELFADTPDGPFSLNLLFDRAIAEGRLHGERGWRGAGSMLARPRQSHPAEAALARRLAGRCPQARPVRRSGRRALPE